MLRKYAIVYASWTFRGDGLADLPYLVVAPFHWMKYERICGYSLGHQPTFCDSLEDAKASCTSGSAVIEFSVDLEANSITNLNNIHVITGSKKLLREVNNTGYQGRFFEPCDVPEWEVRQIQQDDLTAGAFDLFNRAFQEHHVDRRLDIL